MPRIIISIFKILFITFSVSFASVANSALLLDGDFEQGPQSTPWTFTPTASLSTDLPLLGSQSLILSNTGFPLGGYIVAFQTVALDGNDFFVGDRIFMSALAQLFSPARPVGRVFMEIAFRNGGTADVVGQIGDIDFGNSVFTELVFGLSNQGMFSTPSVVIPDQITSINGITAATTGIRVAFAIGPVVLGDALTEVKFDKARLQKVSEPSAIVLLALSLFLMRVRLKKVQAIQ